MKRILTILFIFTISLPGIPMFATGRAEIAENFVLIGVSVSNRAADRSPGEIALFSKLGQIKGIQVITQVSNQDPDLQNKQIENIVYQGAKALIIVAQDAHGVVPTVDAAAASGIPIIAYEQLINSPNLAAYLSFDHIEIGRMQSKAVADIVHEGRFVMLGGHSTDNNAVLLRRGQTEILQPFIDTGKVEIIADPWIENWSSDTAFMVMKKILIGSSKPIDAVIASSDDIALGALHALKSQHHSITMPVIGMGATLAGCQSIAKGELSTTFLKDMQKLASTALDMAIVLAKGETVPELKSFSLAKLTRDDALQGSVPCMFLPVTQVSTENIYEDVILPGYHLYSEVYR